MGLLTTLYKRAQNTFSAITDTFTRANAATLGNTETGQAWSVISGAWSISSNKAAASGSGSQIAAVDAGVANCTVKANVTSSGNAAGIAFRVVDASNYWVLTIRNDGFAQLNRVVAGASSTVGNLGGAAYSAGGEIKVVLNGSSIAVWYGGTQRNTYTDTAHQTATKHGLFSSFTGTTHDDFSITA